MQTSCPQIKVTFRRDARTEDYRTVAKCILSAVNTTQPLLAWLEVDQVIALANGKSPEAGQTVLKFHESDEGMNSFLGQLRNCQAVANAESPI
jgi:hypothetical protein